MKFVKQKQIILFYFKVEFGSYEISKTTVTIKFYFQVEFSTFENCETKV